MACSPRIMTWQPTQYPPHQETYIHINVWMLVLSSQDTLSAHKAKYKVRREGRQHGLVRTHVILPWPLDTPRPNSRVVNKLEGPPTAGAFTRVSSKPTNHSKFTGKRCSRVKPKPKNKSNGPKKFGPRSDGFDALLNGPRFGNGNEISAHDDELRCHETEEVLEDEVNGCRSDYDADGYSDWLLV